jgi:hypothetical protein
MTSLAGAANDLVTADSPSLLLRYYDFVRATSARYEGAAPDGAFEPATRLPELDGRIAAFLKPATASYIPVGDYRGMPLHVLDLRQNPATRTTKTFAASMIVLRAVNHIRETGESVLVFSPSSGNKAAALRDAVARALAVGLVDAGQLRVATLTPEETVWKMRACPLVADEEGARRNPMFVLTGGPAERVKQVGREVMRRFDGRGGTRLWNSLRPENYRFADQVRAFFDYEAGPARTPQRPQLHAHAVSSAYGLLGYQSGVDVLRERGFPVVQPGYLLVQHLACCDMVLYLRDGTFDAGNRPAYVKGADGLWRQDGRPDFPAETWAPEEVLDWTFYARRPATSVEMTGLIRAHGGGGIVVSLLECLRRYGEVRLFLGRAGIDLPEDPRLLNEWSAVMAVTGVLNAIDRGMLDGFGGVTVHASGAYGRHDYEPVRADRVVMVGNADDLLARL